MDLILGHIQGWENNFSEKELTDLLGNGDVTIEIEKR